MNNNQFGGQGAPVPPQGPPQYQAPQGGGTQGTNTLMAVISYLGILLIIPFLTGAKNDPFVKYHMKQGLVLFIVWVAIWIIARIVYAIAPFLGLLFSVVYLGLFVLIIMGIMNAVKGVQKELPLIGSFASKFNF